MAPNRPQTSIRLDVSIGSIVTKMDRPSDVNKPPTKDHSATAKHGLKKNPRLSSATAATVCFSRLELTLHGSPALCLAADVVVLPLHTRHRHRQHAMDCLQHYP